MKTKKKENIIIIVILVIMLLAIIGVSYAAFNFSKQGNVPNKITTGSITMTYEESDNTISIGNALPTTDKTGTTRLKDGEYFDFTVSSEITGEVNINYEISAKEVGEGTIDGSNIKLYLTRLTDDGEEELMSPEVYNEEASSNEYTGRPAGEMSLYTSSMNSSESNDYRLRMYVTEEYNPQGDGGGLTFTVKVNVYGKAGDKPLTGAEMLIEKANPEDLDYNSATDEEKKEMWTHTHPETEQTEALTDYRYIGTDPNNYVQFNDEEWRIIGVFTVDDGTGNKEERLKITRNRAVTGNYAWDTSNSNDWTNSTIKTILNSGDYWTNKLTIEAKEMIGDAVWYLGGTSTYTSDDNGLVSHWYSYERGTNVYPGRSTFWIGKVGLMYPSDIGYAVSGGLTTDRTTCLEKNIYNGRMSFPDCYNSDWFYGSWQWTITPGSNDSRTVFRAGDVSDINPDSASNSDPSIYPAVYLKSSIKIVDGDGSSSNPYILQS